MKATWLALALATMLCVNAFAQRVYVDEFYGGFNPNLPWSWIVVIPNPNSDCDYVNTEHTTEYPYRFEDGKLVIVMHPWNGTYQQYNYAANFPNLPVVGFDPGWAIETEVTLNLRGNIPTTYTQAGIMVMGDLDNYYHVMLVVMPNDGNNPHRFWVSTAVESNAQYNYGGASWFTGDWGVDAPQFTAAIRLEDAGVDDQNRPLIRMRFKLPNMQDFQDAWPPTYPRPAILSQVAQNGGRVGLFHLAGFTGDPQPEASFSYIRLENIRIRIPGDVNGDCVVNNADLLQVLFAFGSSGENLPPDVNSDCSVNNADLLTVLFNFGSGC